MKANPTNADKFDQLQNQYRNSKDFLQQAFIQVEKEDGDKIVETAKGLIRRAKDLRAQKAVLEKEFAASMKQIEDNLGQIMNQIHKMSHGVQEIPDTPKTV